MMRRFLLPIIAFFILAVASLSASMNVTYLNTTVILNQNTSAHVIEIFTVYVSNSSVMQYVQDRQAINPTIANWQKALDTNLLVEHILNPVSSVYGFTFLPGPITTGLNGGIAHLEMTYNVRNVTSVVETAPRQFEYTFNDSVFNFQNTASGESLPTNARLNIIVPGQSQIVSLYPLPDYPQFSFIGSYSGATTLSWFSGEPLSTLSLKYITSQTLQAEVMQYFGGVYSQYGIELLVLIIAVIAVYIFFYVRRASERA